MKGVFVFFAKGFEEIEALTNVDLLRRAGVEVTMVSISDELVVEGSHGIKVTCDTVLSEADFQACRIMLLPGGMPGTSNLEACQPLMAKLDEFYDAGENGADKYIAAICAAPSIFAHRGYLKGRRACVNPGFESHLRDAGVEPLQVSCVRDGHIFTSRAMGTAHELGLALVELYTAGEKAGELRKATLYP